MKAQKFEKATVHWMPMGASCHVAIHRGTECKDSVAIRPNVPLGAAPPVAWQAGVSRFPHDREMTEAEATSDLKALGPVTLMPEVHDQMGEVEMRGATDALKFWISTHSLEGIDPLSEAQKAEYREYLTSLAEMLFGVVRLSGDAGSAAWR